MDGPMGKILENKDVQRLELSKVVIYYFFSRKTKSTSERFD